MMILIVFFAVCSASCFAVPTEKTAETQTLITAAPWLADY
tara:strand:- start:252 stop:371 length:120 start_codon:yes stop_codon:yes gene_type:complete